MSVSLEIVSPSKLLVSQSVDMVVIPGLEGDIGVLQEHSPMITVLRGGEVILYEGERVTARYFVTGGFAEITEERVTVLADTAEPSSSLNRADGERQLSDAMRELGEAEKAGRLDRLVPLMEKVQVAQAIVDVTGSSH
ncbi:MAG TPA: ATP synthase F1 subunit epsilon [Acidisoma sp.]|uniref:ATP synthase F1 subunit epsilon n=1 Tax=Acidisoma sp. TaxID=1872115 RepID=UPI002D17A85F|nr:ATP synthase F1 subunit epsilon [Acidisoma sp.]HTH99878.1 ATP synthase F1 subunit epsilon [Acidisoma sp.]